MRRADRRPDRAQRGPLPRRIEKFVRSFGAPASFGTSWDGTGRGDWWASLPRIRARNQAFSAAFRALTKRLTPTVTPSLAGLSQAPLNRASTRPVGYHNRPYARPIIGSILKPKSIRARRERSSSNPSPNRITIPTPYRKRDSSARPKPTPSCRLHQRRYPLGNCRICHSPKPPPRSRR
jgi:hypothetical protein